MFAVCLCSMCVCSGRRFKPVKSFSSFVSFFCLLADLCQPRSPVTVKLYFTCSKLECILCCMSKMWAMLLMLSAVCSNRPIGMCVRKILLSCGELLNKPAVFSTLLYTQCPMLHKCIFLTQPPFPSDTHLQTCITQDLAENGVLVSRVVWLTAPVC